ncbi:MAG: Asp-tRNA(Asn)/Glu-tRNA(Gln) amidotransferase subunit GatC [Clostridiales bacterium]
MKITDELIDYVSALAKLDLNSEEKAKTKDEIGKIIDYMEVLNTLDTTGIEPMSHVLPTTNVFREDEIKPSHPRDEILANAPDGTEGAFRVPKTVE